MTIAKDQLRSYIERIERLEEEKKSIADDIRDVFAEAKSNGYDVKALRAIVRLRKIDADERMEQEVIMETYLHALGMLADTPLGTAAIDRSVKASVQTAAQSQRVERVRSAPIDNSSRGGGVSLPGEAQRPEPACDFAAAEGDTSLASPSFCAVMGASGTAGPREDITDPAEDNHPAGEPAAASQRGVGNGIAPSAGSFLADPAPSASPRNSDGLAPRPAGEDRPSPDGDYDGIPDFLWRGPPRSGPSGTPAAQPP